MAEPILRRFIHSITQIATNRGWAQSIMYLYKTIAHEFTREARTYGLWSASTSSRASKHGSWRLVRRRQSWGCCGGTGDNGTGAPPGDRDHEPDAAQGPAQRRTGRGLAAGAGRLGGPNLGCRSAGPSPLDPSSARGRSRQAAGRLDHRRLLLGHRVGGRWRSEEHTSELQSRLHLV